MQTYGHAHLHQSLPRLLTLWFDHGDVLIELCNGNRQRSHSWPKDFNEFLDQAPEYQLVPALTQMVSRCLTKKKHVKDVLFKVFTRVSKQIKQITDDMNFCDSSFSV